VTCSPSSSAHRRSDTPPRSGSLFGEDTAVEPDLASGVGDVGIDVHSRTDLLPVALGLQRHAGVAPTWATVVVDVDIHTDGRDGLGALLVGVARADVDGGLTAVVVPLDVDVAGEHRLAPLVPKSTAAPASMPAWNPPSGWPRRRR
jgi:hypothetical protein